MIIEFSNATEPKSHSTMALAIVITACALFFIPTTLIVLGYYSSQPTGTLISPLPQGVLSEQPLPKADQPMAGIIAADNIATEEAVVDITPKTGNNILDKVAAIEINATETEVVDPDITESTQIFLSPREGDKSLYSVKSKESGKFTIGVGSPSDIVRYIDYHLVNP